MKKEKANSLTCLLAVIFTYKLLRKFSDSTTQHDILGKFNVKQKQLAACITGRKYLDGTDRKLRKCITSGNSGKPSTTKKLATE